MMEEAGELAERAIVLDPFDARALTIAGHVRAYLHRRLHEAASLHERALSLNPNLAMAWALSAITYAYMGEADEAERRNNRYKKLSPLDPHAFFFDAFFILIHLMKRDYESAVAVGRAVSEMNPSFSATYKPYLAALGHLGRHTGGRGGAPAAAVDRTGFHRRALHRDFAAGARERSRPLRAGLAAGRCSGECRRVGGAIANARGDLGSAGRFHTAGRRASLSNSTLPWWPSGRSRWRSMWSLSTPRG